MKVYVSIRGNDWSPLEILGVFIEKQSAVDCCLAQPTFTRDAWRLTEDEEEYWHNGHGLFVKVAEHYVR